MNQITAKLYIPAKSDVGRPARLFLPYRPALGPKFNRRFVNRLLPKRANLGMEPGWVWTFNRTHASAVMESVAEEFGTVEVFADYNSMTKCDRRCREARGEDCECSCLGLQHGGGMLMAGWEILVGENTVLSGDRVRTRRVLRRAARRAA